MQSAYTQPWDAWTTNTLCVEARGVGVASITYDDASGMRVSCTKDQEQNSVQREKPHNFRTRCVNHEDLAEKW